MRLKEMRDLTSEDLTAKVDDTRKEIVQLRFQLAGRKLENPAAIRNARKRLARLLTLQTERALELKR